MIMRNLLKLAIIALPTASSVHALESHDSENLRALMIASLDEQVTNDLSQQLQDGEMAEAHAQKTITVLVEAVSACTLDALVRLAGEQSLDPVTIFAQLEASLLKGSNEGVDTGLNEERMKEELNYCFVVAFENAGVEAQQITP